MTNQQKLRFYEIVSKSGLDWKKFVFGDLSHTSKDESITKIFYNESGYYFLYKFNKLLVDSDTGAWEIEYAPGKNYTPVESFILHHKFEEILKDFTEWIEILKAENNADQHISNLREIQSNVNELNLSHENLNETFNQSEIEEIKLELNNFRTFLKSLPVERDELNEINNKIDYLIERTKYPKVDWLNLFVGTMFNLAFNGALTIISNWEYIEKLKGLFQVIIRILKLKLSI